MVFRSLRKEAVVPQGFQKPVSRRNPRVQAYSFRVNCCRHDNAGNPSGFFPPQDEPVRVGKEAPVRGDDRRQPRIVGTETLLPLPNPSPTTRYSSSTGVFSREWTMRLVKGQPSGIASENTVSPFSRRIEITLTGQLARAIPRDRRKRKNRSRRIFLGTASPCPAKRPKRKSPLQGGWFLAGPARLELATYGLGGRRSIHLSYGPTGTTDILPRVGWGFNLRNALRKIPRVFEGVLRARQGNGAKRYRLPRYLRACG